MKDVSERSVRYLRKSLTMTDGRGRRKVTGLSSRKISYIKNKKYSKQN